MLLYSYFCGHIFSFKVQNNVDLKIKGDFQKLSRRSNIILDRDKMEYIFNKSKINYIVSD